MAEQATHGFTRRSFIKGAAALTATGALVAAAPKPRTWKKPNRKREPRDANLLRCLPLPMRPGLLSGCPCSRRQVVRTTAGHFEDGPEFDRICPRGSRSLRAYTALSVCNIPCVASANVARESSSVSPGRGHLRNHR